MADKKRLHNFLGDLLKVGCAKGFKYFATHLRGREEMICSIINEPSIPILLSAANSPASSFAHHIRDAQPNEPSGSALISQKQQRRLSGYGFINVGLPPASPSENEEDVEDACTMFLIAGYARYNRPYVWVRSNHERLVRLSSEDPAAKDYPLQLNSTSQWQEKNIKVWDVIAELVEICTVPCPPNPFAVDFDYFEALHLPERALASGAMSSFLQRVLASGTHSYDRKVQSDLLKISRCHFQAILQLVQQGALEAPPTTATPSEPSEYEAAPQRRVSASRRPPSATRTAHQPRPHHTPSSSQPPAGPPPSEQWQPSFPTATPTPDPSSGQQTQFYSGRSRTGYMY